jgi:small acid-soluble spore protein E (minor gamma-type SASP)
MDRLMFVEVITMANNQQPNKTQAGTNIQEVRQQNAQSAGQGQFGTEFASETNAQQVRQQNQQAEAKKAQNSGQSGQNS